MELRSPQEVVSRLSLEQKISLISGKSYWRTQGIPEHGIKTVKLSDGPNGVRGENIHASTKGYCFPCGSCVGATFNVDLVYEMGKALGKECKVKNAGVLLGPTINLHRSPLGGRNFEAYSEDCTLSGIFGAAYVNGVQSQSVVACPKHFVGNECEKYRKTSNSVIDEKALRELYAYAFQLTIKHSNPGSIMSSYNKVNGTTMSENSKLLQGLLRHEWGFAGIVISDFEGVYSQNAPINAGLDLEMPGPPRCRGKQVIDAVHNGDVEESQIDILAGRIVALAAKIGMDDELKKEQMSHEPETERLIRNIASEGIVLLKNKEKTLPLYPASKPKIAVFGTPAKTPTIHGGGSASITPSYLITPLAALQQKYSEASVTYDPGVPIFKKIPSAPVSSMKTEGGSPGVECFWYNGSVIGENLVYQEVLETTRTLLIEPRIKDLRARYCSRMQYVLTPATTGQHTFGVTACGRTVVKVDGKQILEHVGFSDVKVEYIMQPGDFEVRAEVEMVAGHKYHVVVDTLSTTAPSPSPVFTIAPQATQVGFFENLSSASTAKNVQTVAAASDISIVFTANNKEYESESFDRETLSLSSLQNDLISAVAQASAKTVVINQTGAPISMPWLDQVDAVLQCWFAGQEVGNALVDIISGQVSPSGKLPITFPRRIEDSPTYTNFPTDENHEIRYEEGLEIGYRARLAPAALFPFGFGLSYTTFEVSDLHVEGTGTCAVTVSAVVSNTGDVAGQEVVQVYVNGILKGFKKVSIAPGQSAGVRIELDKYAFSEWDVQRGVWIARAQSHTIDIREDSQKVRCQTVYVLRTEHVWKGL